MIITITGNVVKIDRHVNDSKMSLLRLAFPNAGQTIEDGKYGQRETGYWDVQVFEENLMAFSNKDFSGMMGAIKPGSTVEVVAEVVFRTTKQGGKTTRKDVVLTAGRLSFVSTARKQDETGVQASTETPARAQAAQAEQEGFQEIPTGDEEGSYDPEFGF